MSFINKNANVFLLFLLILSATILVAATVFFQINFERINTEYNVKLQQLQQVSKELDSDRALLERTKGELTVKSQREESLGQQYTEVKTTKEKVESQKAQLEKNKEQLENELEKTNANLRDASAEIAAKKDIINTLTKESDDLKSQLAASDRLRRQAQDDLSTCQTAKAKCTCP